MIQDAQAFNESPLHSRRCCTVLLKTLYLLYHGQVFTSKEATSLFFAVSKAFQSKDVPPPLCHSLLARQACAS